MNSLTAEIANIIHDNALSGSNQGLLQGNTVLCIFFYLLSQGAGKVVVGQEVIIRLDNYPYMEYGSIGGRVTMISALSNQSETFAKKNDIQTYLITVDLPNKLTTNYGTTLDFNYEIKGVTDILTKKRKLLLRLFDNLKYIASKKTI